MSSERWRTCFCSLCLPVSKSYLVSKATNYKDIMPKENKGKGQEPQSAPANTEKGQENRPRRKRIRQQALQTNDELMNEGHA